MFRIDRIAAIAALLCVGSLTLPHDARAETFNTCAGFIDTVPTTISTQGVWCLKKDLATNISSGAAITIAANNVTIDCNDFKIGGLAAGDASQTSGIKAMNRQNATVRHCNVRGFLKGIELVGSTSAGHLIEDNRLDNNLYVGISVAGANNLVRGNRVFDTGGRMGGGASIGIDAQADIIGNTIRGVLGSASGTTYIETAGIRTSYSTGWEISDNRVSGIVAGTASTNAFAMAIRLYEGTAQTRVFGNHLSEATAASAYSYGISSWNINTSACGGNTILGFTYKIYNCFDAGGNTTM
jgi:parallel beta-helix repeat protein